jgi:hypothetical protein
MVPPKKYTAGETPAFLRIDKRHPHNLAIFSTFFDLCPSAKNLHHANYVHEITKNV